MIFLGMMLGFVFTLGLVGYFERQEKEEREDRFRELLNKPLVIKRSKFQQPDDYPYLQLALVNPFTYEFVHVVKIEED